MTKHTILFLAANPFGTDRLALDQEARAIQAELARSIHREMFEFVTRWAVQPLDLLRELRDLKPTVVHFSGHGVRSELRSCAGTGLGIVDSTIVADRVAIDEDHRPGLFFEGPDGRPRLVSMATLEGTFGAAGESVKLVVLSACYSELQADALLLHVDCVVGMRGLICENAARNFAIGFYGGLGACESIAAAHRQGCAAISMESLHDGVRPQLRVRTGMDATRFGLADPSPRHTSTLKSSASASDSSTLQPSVHIEIVFDSNCEDFNGKSLERVIKAISLLSGDPSVRMICVRKGSVRVAVLISSGAARKLLELRQHGLLTEICDFRLLAIRELTLPEIEDLIATLPIGYVERTVAPTFVERTASTQNTNESDEGSSAELALDTVDVGLSDESIPVLPVSRRGMRAARRFQPRVTAARIQLRDPVKVGHFLLVGLLGKGSMAEVYEAYDNLLDRRVALKFVRRGYADLKPNDYMLREAQVLAKLSHPNVVQIYEAGKHSGRLFIAMELIQGQTLTAWLNALSPMPWAHRQRKILRHFIVAGRGLEAVHAIGVAHRDFKPDNVLVGYDGRICVIDFGLARMLVDDPAPRLPAPASGDGPVESAFVHGEPPATDLDMPPSKADTDPAKVVMITTQTRLTRTGVVMGTPRFMAPEQIRGGVPDQRSDQFSFCVALYHALCNVFPFQGERLNELLDAIEAGVDDLESRTRMPSRVRKALRRGLSADPTRRFSNMNELLVALEPWKPLRGGWLTSAILLIALVVVLYIWLSS